MVRIFSSYVPTRLLVLLFGEIVVACTSFLLAVRICFGGEGVVLANQQATLKFSVGVVLAILCLHYLGLHSARRPSAPEQLHSRILMFAALPSLTLAILCGLFPNFAAGGVCVLYGVFDSGCGLDRLALGVLPADFHAKAPRESVLTGDRGTRQPNSRSD